MPFEKFKPPKLHAALGTIIGVSQGVMIAKVMKSVTESTNTMRAKGCPNPAQLAKLDNKLTQLSGLTGKLKSTTGAFKAVPKTLKAPIGGLKAAVAIILAIPIPQAFPHVYVGPPGLPVNTTTKFADTLNLLKEFIAAMIITSDAIEGSLSNVESSVKSIDGNLKALSGPVAACKIENAIKGKLTKEQAGKLKLLDKDGEYITSTFGSKVLEKENTRPAKEQIKLNLENKFGFEIKAKGSATIEELNKKKFTEKGEAFRLTGKDTFKGPNGETLPVTGKEMAVFDGEKFVIEVLEDIKPGGLTGQAQALAELDQVLKELSDRLNNVTEGLSDDLDVPTEVLQELQGDLLKLSDGLVVKEADAAEDPDLFYKGYELRIIRDPQSPQLAPKHFAIALKDGKQELKGPSSFSSSKEVLLEEIKFRIDNQLS